MTETRKIAAILVADVVGYSRLAGSDEDRTLARLRALRSDLIDPTIALHHGRVVKRTGDGILIEFRSVVDAVRCAIEVQNGMVERNSGLPPERRIEFRVGIHLGDVVEEADGDLMGDGVNIAARLEGIAGPGAICLSEDAPRLKNIADPIRVYSLQVGVPAQAKPPAPKRRSRHALLGAGIAALLIMIAASGWYLSANRPAPVASKPAEAAHLSIVVLPFGNLSGDPAQDYLADALTDELTTSVARIPNSFVIARNTAFTYRGKPVDAKAIGKDLGVRYVLEGSVQPSGSQVRVNAQLIDADSGAHLWADQFDTPRTDLLQTQDEIVTRLARAMYLQLLEVEAAKRTPAANPRTERRIYREGSGRGLPFLRTGACDRSQQRPRPGLFVPEVLLPVAFGLSADPRADELVSQALALDPNFAPAHEFRGIVLHLQGRVDESIAESERALALDPSKVDAMGVLAWDYMVLGQFDAVLKYVDSAIRLSPRDPALFNFHEMKSASYFALKQYDQAIDSARQSIAIRPDHHFAHRNLIAALALTGHEAEAQEALQRFLELPPAGMRTIAAWRAYKAQMTNAHPDPRVLEFWDRTFEGLRKARMPEE